MSFNEYFPKEQANPALLTRSEIDWLLGKKEVSKGYEYFLRSTIRKKLKTFKELELPLLEKKGFIENQSPDLSANSNVLSANAKVENNDNLLTSITRGVRSAGFEPAIPSLGSSYLNQAGLTSHDKKSCLVKIKAFVISG